jgi:DNA-binding winged helix-turn-helix (wHTH) protein
MGKLVVFDNLVVYNSSKALLYNINTPEKQSSLYAPTNKCLSLLIEARPDVISQHVFFEQVWEKDGLSITANTFYQHIAMLRRAFEDVGLTQEVIVTIPRRGLCLSDKLSLTFDGDTTEVLCEDGPSVLNKQDAVSGTGKRVKQYQPVLKRLLLYAISGGVVFLLAFFGTQRLTGEGKTPNDILGRYKYIGDVNGCKVSVFSSLSSLEDVRDKINENGIECITYNKIYYSTLPLLNRTSLMACSEDAKEGVKCLSYFFITSR